MESTSSSSRFSRSTIDCCFVCSLLQKGFSSLNYPDQMVVIEEGRPQPLLAKLSSKGKGHNRYFNADLYEQYDWLTGCETLCRLFCWPCMLYATEVNGVWNRTGYCDLNNLHKVLKRHSISQAHLRAIIQEKLFVNSRGECNSDQLKVDNLKHNEQVEKNRGVLQRLIDVVCYPGQHREDSVACTNRENFSAISVLLSKYDALLKSHLNESTAFFGKLDSIHKNIVSAITAVVLQHIKSEIKRAQFVAIILNETLDSSEKSGLSVVLRYIVEDSIRERFLGFLDITGERTAVNVYEALCCILRDYDIDQQVISQSYNGPIVMGTTINDLQVKVKERFPSALVIHCRHNDVDSILSQSVAHIPECRIFYAVLSGINECFSRSVNHTRDLNQIAWEMMPKFTSTQWNGNKKLVQTVYEYRLPLIKYFEKILENCCSLDHETLIRAKSFLVYLKSDVKFNLLLNIFNEIFPVCDELLSTLQTKMDNVAYCTNKVKDFKSFLDSKKSRFETMWNQTVMDENFEPLQAKRSRTDCDHMKPTTPSHLPDIINQLNTYIDSRLATLNDLEFLQLCNLSDNGNKHFPEAALQSLFHHYGRHFDIQALRPQLIVVYDSGLVKSKNALGVLQYLKQTGLNKAFSEVVKLFELAITIRVTIDSEDCKSVVSERVQKFVTESASEDRFSELSVLSIERDLLKELWERPKFYDNVFEQFTKRDENIELHYKYDPE